VRSRQTMKARGARMATGTCEAPLSTLQEARGA
jgi:hypothetical protein